MKEVKNYSASIVNLNRVPAILTKFNNPSNKIIPLAIVFQTLTILKFRQLIKPIKKIITLSILFKYYKSLQNLQGTLHTLRVCTIRGVHTKKE